jgi:hypothetical protein
MICWSSNHSRISLAFWISILFWISMSTNSDMLIFCLFASCLSQLMLLRRRLTEMIFFCPFTAGRPVDFPWCDRGFIPVLFPLLLILLSFFVSVTVRIGDKTRSYHPWGYPNSQSDHLVGVVDFRLGLDCRLSGVQKRQRDGNSLCGLV